MKFQLNQINFKTLSVVALSAIVMSCSNDEQDVVEKDLNAVEDETLVPESDNLTDACSTAMYTYPGDVNSAVNTVIDDRSCVYNYTQTTFGTSYTWGYYRLRANTSSDHSQTRIERASKIVSNKKSGNYVNIRGWVRINRVGDGASTNTNGNLGNSNGTYFIQAKGKHTGGGGSPDPAICLFVAKPIKVGNDDYFDIYREEIITRGGEGSGGRTLYGPITRVRKNTDFYVSVSTGFHQAPGRSLSHYVNASINGVTANFQVPQAWRSTQAKLRMGAYRCKGGEAEILWRSVQTSFVNNP
ncbi:hypothetical protein [Algibacter pectinivorans]|uniref:PL28 ulvan lyase domain-containing protein n=1 Tax=Algibacter pectinivorans TaxID=870482 RepID=A0A1I1QV52_9FLAO|nr:hypothetical protein [Algibacter pectinivorans]SFD25976.1 hypothetical protein SAMN04487987_107204 [Algibacter pectinivorans]